MSAATRPESPTAEAPVPPPRGKAAKKKKKARKKPVPQISGQTPSPEAEDQDETPAGPEETDQAEKAAPTAEEHVEEDAFEQVTTARSLPRPVPPFLNALTGLAVLAAPFAVVGEFGTLATLESDLAERILAGCAIGFDLLLVLCGANLAWRTTADRRGLWGLGIGPLLAGLMLISGAALILVLEPATAAVVGLATLGRALAGIGTGTLTVYWLRINSGSVRVPAHRPTLPDRARTSRSAPILALAALLFCAYRTDLLATTYLLPVYLIAAWLIVTLIRAPHSPLTRALSALGRAVPRRRPAKMEPPVIRQILLPEPRTSMDETPDRRDGQTSKNIYVAHSGRVIDLDAIPSELRLLPLPRTAGQKEQSASALQTE